MSKENKTKVEKHEKVCTPPEENKSVLPLIKKKYMSVMILLVVLAVFLTSFFVWIELFVSYLCIWLLLWASYVMYNDLYCFQKFSFKYRPFVMTQYFEIFAIACTTALIVYTIPMASTSGQWVPYIMLWLIAWAVWFQFRSMFWTAKSYKKDDPTKCEFC